MDSVTQGDGDLNKNCSVSLNELPAGVCYGMTTKCILQHFGEAASRHDTTKIFLAFQNIETTTASYSSTCSVHIFELHI